MLGAARGALRTLGTAQTTRDAGGGCAGAGGEGEYSGAEVDDDEDGGKPHSHFRRVVAEEHVQMDGGDGVEEGTAWYEQGLYDHGSVMRLSRDCTCESCWNV